MPEQEMHRVMPTPDLPYRLVLFDLDGTLTDPKPGITRCVAFALERFGIAVADPDDLVPFIGPPLADSFARFYGFGDEDCRRAIAAYRERFADVGLYENAVYPGIPEVLDGLRAAGALLAVASSKPTVYVERILAHFGLRDRFAAVAGSTLDLARTAKHEVIAHLRDEHPALPWERAVMVGDREHDVFGARAHGLPAIAVGYGYGPPAELRAAAPIAIAPSVDALARLLGVGDGRAA
jgi:phosphoglycolate phosphatase